MTARINPQRLIDPPGNPHPGGARPFYVTIESWSCGQLTHTIVLASFATREQADAFAATCRTMRGVA